MRGEGGIPILIGGTDDHVHVLLTLRQDMSLADLLRALKSKSSRWIHETFPDLRDFAWQRGYGAFTVSMSQKDRVCAYIDRQEQHHRNEDFKTEIRRFLTAHGIDFDEEYLWG